MAFTTYLCIATRETIVHLLDLFVIEEQSKINIIPLFSLAFHKIFRNETIITNEQKIIEEAHTIIDTIFEQEPNMSIYTEQRANSINEDYYKNIKRILDSQLYLLEDDSQLDRKAKVKLCYFVKSLLQVVINIKTCCDLCNIANYKVDTATGNYLAVNKVDYVKFLAKSYLAQYHYHKLMYKTLTGDNSSKLESHINNAAISTESILFGLNPENVIRRLQEDIYQYDLTMLENEQKSTQEQFFNKPSTSSLDMKMLHHFEQIQFKSLIESCLNHLTSFSQEANPNLTVEYIGIIDNNSANKLRQRLLKQVSQRLTPSTPASGSHFRIQ